MSCDPFLNRLVSFGKTRVLGDCLVTSCWLYCVGINDVLMLFGSMQTCFVNVSNCVGILVMFFLFINYDYKYRCMHTWEASLSLAN